MLFKLSYKQFFWAFCWTPIFNCTSRGGKGSYSCFFSSSLAWAILWCGFMIALWYLSYLIGPLGSKNSTPLWRSLSWTSLCYRSYFSFGFFLCISYWRAIIEFRSLLLYNHVYAYEGQHGFRRYKSHVTGYNKITEIRKRFERAELSQRN